MQSGVCKLALPQFSGRAPSIKVIRFNFFLPPSSGGVGESNRRGRTGRGPRQSCQPDEIKWDLHFVHFAASATQAGENSSAAPPHFANARVKCI